MSKSKASKTPLLDKLRNHPNMRKLLGLKLFICEVDEFDQDSDGGGLEERGLKRYKKLKIEKKMEEFLQEMIEESKSEKMNFIESMETLDFCLVDDLYIYSGQLEERLKTLEDEGIDGIEYLVENYLKEVKTEYREKKGEYKYYKKMYNKG